MASRRSSQLSYIRAPRVYPGLARLYVQRSLDDELVRELVLLAADGPLYTYAPMWRAIREAYLDRL